MKDSYFTKRIRQDKQALETYTRAIEWDPVRLSRAMSSTGLPHEDVYLETPNQKLIDHLSTFILNAGTNFFFILGPNGFGKSSIKDFSLLVFKDINQYVSFSLDNIGPITTFQMLREIYLNMTGLEKAPRTRGELKDAIVNHLITTRSNEKLPITTIVWIDEGQKLTSEKLEALRMIADTRTLKGDFTCKFIIVGTEGLKTKIANWMTTHDEEGMAVMDRGSQFTYDLNPWDEQHIFNWWTLLTEYCSINQSTDMINPFQPVTAKIVHKLSEGKPRDIVQLSQLALLARADKYLTDPKNGWTVRPDDIMDALGIKQTAEKKK